MALFGTQQPVEFIEHISTQLAEARARAIAAVSVDAACVICREPYPSTHLLRPTIANEVTACPTCAFDDSLWIEAYPQRLASEIHRLASEDLAAPAEWAAVDAVLACATVPPNLVTEPGNVWIWLPPAGRPAALADFGPGACLRAITSAIDSAHPDLREHVQRQVEADLAEEPGAYGQPLRIDDCFVEQLWPAAIAYAVTSATASVERRKQSSPTVDVHDQIHEHTLTDHLACLGSGLTDSRSLDAIITLEVGAQVIAKALGWATGHHVPPR